MVSDYFGKWRICASHETLAIEKDNVAARLGFPVQDDEKPCAHC